MNVPDSDSSAAIMNFKVNGDTNFKRKLIYKENGVAVDTTYWEGEFVVFYPHNCKEIYNWNTANGKLAYIDVGTYQINELIDVAGDVIDKGAYEYYWLLIDGDGVRLKYLQGMFVVE